MSKARSASPAAHGSGGGGASGGSAPRLTISIPPCVEEVRASYERGGAAEVKRLLKRGPKLFVNQTLDNGERIMSFAIRMKNSDLCEVLLVAGEHPDGIVQIGPDKGFTFLQSAAMEGNVKIVKLLLAFGAKIDLTCERDLSVWDVAVGDAKAFLTLPDYKREEKYKNILAEAKKRFAEPEPAEAIAAPLAVPAVRGRDDDCKTQ